MTKVFPAIDKYDTENKQTKTGQCDKDQVSILVKVVRKGILRRLLMILDLNDEKQAAKVIQDVECPEQRSSTYEILRQ